MTASEDRPGDSIYQQPDWTCGRCEAVNKPIRSCCRLCGRARYQDDATMNIEVSGDTKTPELFKIRVIKCPHPGLGYEHLVGQEFEVTDAGVKWRRHGTTLEIWKDDCIRVDNPDRSNFAEDAKEIADLHVQRGPGGRGWLLNPDPQNPGQDARVVLEQNREARVQPDSLVVPSSEFERAPALMAEAQEKMQKDPVVEEGLKVIADGPPIEKPPMPYKGRGPISTFVPVFREKDGDVENVPDGIPRVEYTIQDLHKKAERLDVRGKMKKRLVFEGGRVKAVPIHQAEPLQISTPMEWGGNPLTERNERDLNSMNKELDGEFPFAAPSKNEGRKNYAGGTGGKILIECAFCHKEFYGTNDDAEAIEPICFDCVYKKTNPVTWGHLSGAETTPDGGLKRTEEDTRYDFACRICSGGRLEPSGLISHEDTCPFKQFIDIVKEHPVIDLIDIDKLTEWTPGHQAARDLLQEDLRRRGFVLRAEDEKSVEGKWLNKWSMAQEFRAAYHPERLIDQIDQSAPAEWAEAPIGERVVCICCVEIISPTSKRLFSLHNYINPKYLCETCMEELSEKWRWADTQTGIQVSKLSRFRYIPVAWLDWVGDTIRDSSSNPCVARQVHVADCSPGTYRGGAVELLSKLPPDSWVDSLPLFPGYGGMLYTHQTYKVSDLLALFLSDTELSVSFERAVLERVSVIEAHIRRAQDREKVERPWHYIECMMGSPANCDCCREHIPRAGLAFYRPKKESYDAIRVICPPCMTEWRKTPDLSIPALKRYRD